MKLAVLIALLLGAGIAHADRAQPRRGQLRQALVQKFDHDGDGKLQGRERKQAAKALRRLAKRLHGTPHGNASRRERLIRRFDIDGDGHLGPGELPPRVAKRLRRADRNGDGWVDPNELR